MLQTFSRFRLTHAQRFLLFGAATVWFLYFVLSLQRNYQDSWILEGLIWPFMAYIFVLLTVLYKEQDNRWIAVVCSLAVVAISLIPSLKYKQVYGQAIDSVTHFRMVRSLMMTGEPITNIYRSIAGVHSWLAAMGLTGNLSSSDVVKLGFPLLGGIYPLLMYWICRRMKMPGNLIKYVICMSCLAAYPFHSLTGTGFTLVPLMMLLGILVAREYYCDSSSEKITYTLLGLLVLVQLTIWHSTTPLLILVLLVCASGTSILLRYMRKDRTKGRPRVNEGFLRMSLVLAILFIGYHMVEADTVFRIMVSRLYQLFIAENSPADIVPASLFKLQLLEMGQVFLVMYGREALMAAFSAIGLLILWNHRYQFEPLLPAYAYWVLMAGSFVVAFPLSLLGVDFKRLIWIPLAISPFFAAFTLWGWNRAMQRWKKVPQELATAAGLTLAAFSALLFTLEFFICQPLIPRSATLSPDTPEEYSVWLHQVNTAYQQRMITFAEAYAGPEVDFQIDLLGNRQYQRYFSGDLSRGLYLPLAPYMGWNPPVGDTNPTLFLLHWPGTAGGFGEQVKYRSDKYLKELRESAVWSLVYDNGQSFILAKP